MQGFKSIGSAQQFLSLYSRICNLFRPRRHLLAAAECRTSMQARFPHVERDYRRRVRVSDGERLWGKILSPVSARFSVLPAEPLPGTDNPPEQRSNEGIRKLAVRLDGFTSARLAVLLVPLREE